MKKNLLFGAGRGPRLGVLELIKRSGKGMNVQDLATALGMSYMGVKAHCLALASTGHLTIARESATKGRPRMIYKLAESGEQLFVDSGEQLTLDLLRESAGLYGPTAPQKLLLMVFRSLQARYSDALGEKNFPDRVRALVRLRDQEERMCVLAGSDVWEIRESHNPLAAVMQVYPEVFAMEENMIGEVLGVPVERREQEGMVIFSLGEPPRDSLPILTPGKSSP